MVSTSFFTDGTAYSEDDVVTTDYPASTTPSQAPSGFYPDGQPYTQADEAAAEHSADLAAASAAAALASQGAAASSAAAAGSASAAAIAAAAGTATPLVDGTAAVGTSAKWAHEDHVHPKDPTLASVSYVDTKVAAVVNSAPATLDTLNELATALGNDPNFATSTATQLGLKANKTYVDTQDALKAPLASPALTGAPTAPTPTAGDNSTRIATTAFVQNGTMSAAELSFWKDRAAMLDPAAYVYWKGASFSVTVPAGEVMYVLNAWITTIQGSAQWFHRDLGIDECFPVPAGTTIASNGNTDSFLYACRPALVTSDPAYNDPKGLYYSRIAALRATQMSQVSASQAAGSAPGTAGITAFPTDFSDGMLAQVSVEDSAWCILLDPIGRGALNTCIEISDAHQFRPTKALLTPFKRLNFPSISCQGASVSGNGTDTNFGGAGVISYYKLPGSWRTANPLNAYRGAVLADTPRIYYSFEETGGTTVNDAGALALNGAYAGTPIFGSAGAIGDGRSAIRFNSVDDLAVIPASTNFDFAGGDFTYESWVWFDALPTPSSAFDPWIVNAWQVSATGSNSTLLTVQNNKLSLLVKLSGGTTLSVSSTISLAVGRFYHVVAGRSGGNLFIRVVGKETRQTVAIASNIAAHGSVPVWLGGGNTSGGVNQFSMSGCIDEFALYNYALSDARADAHHAASLGW
jgi:hypothetical protein